MIVYKYYPGQQIAKQGLGISVASGAGNSFDLTVATGSLVKGGVTTTLADAKVLNFSSAAIASVAYVMLCKKLSDNSADILVYQFSAKSRGCPVIASLGYDLVEVLAKCDIPAGAISPDALTIEVNEWV